METNQVNFKNGYATLDDTPGFGIDIDDNIKDKFKYVKGTEFNLKDEKISNFSRNTGEKRI